MEELINKLQEVRLIVAKLGYVSNFDMENLDYKIEDIIDELEEIK